MREQTPRTDSLVKQMKGWKQSARANNLAYLCRKLEMKNALLLSAGTEMSNVAFNWAQDSSFSPRQRQMLDQMRKKWDAATGTPS